MHCLETIIAMNKPKLDPPEPPDECEHGVPEGNFGYTDCSECIAKEDSHIDTLIKERKENK